MTKLSVVIITFNEEKNIARCLDSVQGLADEIVVVDSFSKDRTKVICEKYSVRFLEHPFEGHVEQKNWAADQATYDYVLSLDADEAVSEELKKSILARKDNLEAADGYYFNRYTNYCGKWIRHSGWYPDRKLRLWNRHKGRWGGENPHDRFELEKGARMEFLKGDLLHYSINTIEQHMDTINKFSSISAEIRYRKGIKFSFLKMIFSPFWKFISSFIIKGGFRDGFYGYIICRNSAHSNFLKQVKLYQHWKAKD